MLETTSFGDVQIAVYRGSRAIEIVPGRRNSVQKRTKMVINDRNDEF